MSNILSIVINLLEGIVFLHDILTIIHVSTNKGINYHKVPLGRCDSMTTWSTYSPLEWWNPTIYTIQTNVITGRTIEYFKQYLWFMSNYLLVLWNMWIKVKASIIEAIGWVQILVVPTLQVRYHLLD